VTIGEFMHNAEWKKKLGLSININAHINYIRLYGNRAAHYQNYNFSSYDLNLVRTAFKELVVFYYESIDTRIPSDVQHKLNKIVSLSDDDEEYNLDLSLYLETMIAVEESRSNYPVLGKKLLNNIISKIIIDRFGVIDKNFYWLKDGKPTLFLDIEKVLQLFKKNEIIPVKQIAMFEECFTFFNSSSNVYYHEKQVPEAPKELQETFRNLTDWFYRNKSKRNAAFRVKKSLIFIDLLTIFSFLVAVIFTLWRNPATIFISPALEVFIISVGVLLFFLPYSYAVLYNLFPVIRYRRFYNWALKLSSYSGLAGIAVLIYVSYYLLHDGKPDRPYLAFFLSVSTWALSLQLSTFLRSNSKSVNDRFLRALSIFLFGVVVVVIVYLSQYFMNS
jgi:hypothetical protein